MIRAREALYDLGIGIYDDDGDLRNLSSIINEIVGIWDSLSSGDKDYLALELLGYEE